MIYVLYFKYFPYILISMPILNAYRYIFIFLVTGAWAESYTESFSLAGGPDEISTRSVQGWHLVFYE